MPNYETYLIPLLLVIRGVFVIFRLLGRNVCVEFEFVCVINLIENDVSKGQKLNES